MMDMITSEKCRLVSEVVYDITMVAARLMDENKIDVEDSRELFDTIYHLAFEAEENGFDPDYYMEEVDIYATKELMLKYKDFSGFYGRIWWDIEQEEFFDELTLYKEYLTEPSGRVSGITFEEYISNCSTEENGTLELVKGR